MCTSIVRHVNMENLTPLLDRTLRYTIFRSNESWFLNDFTFYRCLICFDFSSQTDSTKCRLCEIIDIWWLNPHTYSGKFPENHLHRVRIRSLLTHLLIPSLCSFHNTMTTVSRANRKCEKIILFLCRFLSPNQTKVLLLSRRGFQGSFPVGSELEMEAE